MRTARRDRPARRVARWSVASLVARLRRGLGAALSDAPLTSGFSYAAREVVRRRKEWLCSWEAAGQAVSRSRCLCCWHLQS